MRGKIATKLQSGAPQYQMGRADMVALLRLLEDPTVVWVTSQMKEVS